VLTPTWPSDLTATPRGRPYNAVTQLREIPACKSSFLEVHLARGVTTWVPTHVPQLLVTRPGSVSVFLSYHAQGSPLGVALSWVVSVPGVLQRWRGYFTSQVTPYWYWDYGLEATFLFSLLLFWGTGARGLLARTVTSCCAAPSTIFPTRGYRGVTLSTPQPSVASTWRRPHPATPKVVNLLTSSLVAHWWVPSYVWPWLWLWLWSTPEDGSVQSYSTRSWENQSWKVYVKNLKAIFHNWKTQICFSCVL